MKDETYNLRQASKKLGINYSSAKTIMRTYKEKGRIYKKLTRDRKKRSIRHFGNEIFQKIQPAAPLSQERNELEHDSSHPTFDLSVYSLIIKETFMARYTEKMRTYESVTQRLTLPVPDQFWLCRLTHGCTTAKLKGKAAGENVLSSTLENT